MSLRAGEVAERAGVNRETLRYYERRGLMGRPDRSPGGHRLYDEQDVVTLRVIKAAQRLGFTLNEVADLIEVGRRRGRDSGLQARAVGKLAEIDARIEDLELIRANLNAALEAGCDDLHQCAGSACCPLPFVDLAEQKAGRTSGSGAARRESADAVSLAAVAPMRGDERRALAAAEARRIMDDPRDRREVEAIRAEMAALQART